jgi:hypothetical protein
MKTMLLYIVKWQYGGHAKFLFAFGLIVITNGTWILAAYLVST